MNCKPGDLARIIGPATTPNRDRIVRCIRLLAKGEEMVLDGLVFCGTSHAEFWAVEGRLEGEDPSGHTIMLKGGPIGDRWLRPIRDPGDDAVDETLLRLPAPREAVPA